MAFSITFIALIFYRISRTFSKTNRTDSSLHFNFFAIQKCYRMPIIAGIFRPIYFNFKIILTSGNVICLYFCIIRSQISPCFGTIYFPTAPLQHCLHQHLCIFILRITDHVIRCTLLHNSSVFHDQYPITEFLYQSQIMTDKEI